jgi:hypothetical protein
MAKKNPTETEAQGNRGGKAKKRSYPASSFEEPLTIPLAIQKYASEQKVRRLTLFDNLKKSPDSGPSRQMIANAAKYGLIKGNYNSEHLELTEDGNIATSSENDIASRLKGRFKLAIEQIAPFKTLYDLEKGKRLPAIPVLEDALIDSGLGKEESKECVETFIVNAKFLGILKTLAGAERIVPIEQLLEEFPSGQDAKTNPALQLGAAPSAKSDAGSTRLDAKVTAGDWEKICFYISPIGDDGSEHRNHSDLFLGSIVEPALEEFKMQVIRADQIGKAGMITKQILEYILNQTCPR